VRWLAPPPLWIGSIAIFTGSPQPARPQ